MIRPEKKRREKHQEMLNNLKAGDSVITIGGIKGKIIKVKDDTIRLRVSSNVDIDMVKNSIASVENPQQVKTAQRKAKKKSLKRQKKKQNLKNRLVEVFYG